MGPTEVPAIIPFPEAQSSAPGVHILRLSVTDRCNFRCRYCAPAQGVAWVPQQDLLPAKELCEQARWLCRQAAIRGIRITGGEPLLRRDLPRIVRELRAIPGIEEITLTTNGSMLALHASELKAAGVARLNVSLDTLNPTRFTQLTRGGSLDLVLRGIETAVAAGLGPLKLNAVLLASTWRQDVPLLLDYAAGLGAEVRFIELMRTGTEKAWCLREAVPSGTVQAWLKTQSPMAVIDDGSGSPARRTHVLWQGRLLTVGWISPRTHPFCSRCERLRMDACGRLRRCLMDPALFDLPAQRAASEERGAVASFLRYLEGKHAPGGMNTSYAMSQVGG